MTYDEFIREFEVFSLRGPCERLQLGLTENINGFSPVDRPEWSATQEKAESLLNTLLNLAPPTDSEDLIDHTLYRLHLEQIRLSKEIRYNGATDFEQMAFAGAHLGDSLFSLLVNNQIDDDTRLEVIATKLESAPSFLSSALDRLERPIERWATMDSEACAGLPSLLSSINALTDKSSDIERQRFVSLSKTVLAAADAYRAQLDKMPKAKNFVIGDQQAERVIATRGIELSPAALVEIASDFLKQTRHELLGLSRKICETHSWSDSPSLAEVQERLVKKFPVDSRNGYQSVLSAYEREQERIRAFISERELFPIPDEELLIIKTPDFLEPSIPAGAMLPPAPLANGRPRSIIYLTLNDALLSEHNQLSLPVMMIHEGIPGHHLQLGTASRHPRFIRRAFNAMDLAEGWTTMLEDYMLDIGYGGALTDEIRFMAKREICRLSARVGIDLFFMTGRLDCLRLDGFEPEPAADVFTNAGRLLHSVTGFVAERINAELSWYSKERGYPLSYLTGNHLMWQLKRHHEALSEPALKSDRMFFELILKGGNMPLSLAKKRLIETIRAQK